MHDTALNAPAASSTGRFHLAGVALVAVLFVAALLAPSLVDRHVLAILISIFFWAALSGSWNIVGGYAGQFSLGHAAFFGIGAYSSAWLLRDFGLSPIAGLLAGMIVAGVCAFVLGAIMFRYKLMGIYFAIGTLAFGEILRVIVGGLPWFGGNGGIPIPLASGGDWTLLQFQPIAFYYLFLGAAAVVMAISWWIGRNRFGYQLAVVRDDEDVAESIGIDPNRLKLRAFVVSAVLAAPIGTFFSQYLMFVEPLTFLSITMAVQIVLPSIIGGLGTVFGPLLGAVILALAIEISNQFSLRPGVSLLVYGIVLMAFSMLLPSGLWSILQKLFRRLGHNA